MLGSFNLIAFVATTNPARARAFYENVLGLRFVADEPAALVFDAHATMFRVQKVESHKPQPYTTLGWEVPDVVAAVKSLKAKGVPCERYDFLQQDELGVWSAPGGAKIAWFKDPDGNTLSLTQF
jgi:catechol 2,3-dioxygenase-like lactoylglutathione lyase family enzyme